MRNKSGVWVVVVGMLPLSWGMLISEGLQLDSPKVSRSHLERDSYYRKAKMLGYRARSAFKLLQIEEEFGLLDRAECVVDLCAAPGSWSQVVQSRLLPRNGTIVAVDVQRMKPLEGVIQIHGDITSQDTLDKVRAHVKGKTCDVVVCDGAPDVTGLHELDRHLGESLAMSAFEAACQLLRSGGSFVVKIFREGSHADFICSPMYSKMRSRFSQVFLRKPHSSRATSHEHFVVCLEFN